MFGSQGDRLLFDSCSKGDVRGVERALKNGADPNRQDSQGWTPLHVACEYGNANVVEVLLKAKCEIFMLSKKDETPWSLASNPSQKAHEGHGKCLQILQDNGVHLGRYRLLHKFKGPVKNIAKDRNGFLTKVRAAFFKVSNLVLVWHSFLLDGALVLEFEGPTKQLLDLRLHIQDAGLNVPPFGKFQLDHSKQDPLSMQHVPNSSFAEVRRPLPQKQDPLGMSSVADSSFAQPFQKKPAMSTPEKMSTLEEKPTSTAPPKKTKKKKKRVKKKEEVGGASIEEDVKSASPLKRLSQIEVMSYMKLKKYCKKVGMEVRSGTLKKNLLRQIAAEHKYEHDVSSSFEATATRKRGNSRRKTLVNMTVYEIMAHIPLFLGWSPARIDSLVRQFETVEFRQQEDLIVQGEQGDEFLIIVEGKCDVLVDNNLVGEVKEGDYVGELALMGDNIKRAATIRAQVPTTCLACARDVFVNNLLDSVTFKKRNKVRKAVAVKQKKTQAALTRQLTARGTELSEKQIDFLTDAISELELFHDFPRANLQNLVGFMISTKVAKGDVIITQGDEDTETFYVVGEGTFDIIIEGKKIATKTKGDCVGEIALMYDQPRNATVQAACECTIWEMKRELFRSIQQEFLQKTNEEEHKFLSAVPEFSKMTEREIGKLVAAFDRVEWPTGSIIIRQAELPTDDSKCYVLREGSVGWHVKDGDGNESSGKLGAPHIFGHLALQSNEPRAATITCTDYCVIMEISRIEFNELLGSLVDLQKRKSLEDSLQMTEEPSVTNLVTTPLEDLKEIGVLGRGAYGLVTLVKDPAHNKSYALKAIKKSQVVKNGMEEYILNEKLIMQKMDNPFLVNLRATYQDSKRLYFLLEVCLGGELFNILRKKNYFKEPTARFYTACVVEGFAHMHANNIIYRDLKPENLVLDSSGYLKITDFGFAKEVTTQTYTFCGTPDYLAPEIIKGTGHSFGVDWWTLGILLYEMLSSTAPFVDHDVNQTYKKILKSHIRFPKFFSKGARQLCLGLLRKKQTRRLGVIAGGAQKIRDHAFFKDCPDWDWKLLQAQKMEPPMIPNVKNDFDLENFQSEFSDEDSSTSESAQSIDSEDEANFDDFT